MDQILPTLPAVTIKRLEESPSAPPKLAQSQRAVLAQHLSYNTWKADLSRIISTVSLTSRRDDGGTHTSSITCSNTRIVLLKKLWRTGHEVRQETCGLPGGQLRGRIRDARLERNVWLQSCSGLA